MKEIMTIQDSFLIPGKGAVASGINPLLDGESDEYIKALIGNRVRISLAGDDGIVLEVRDVALSESLAGKKNISVILVSSDLTPLRCGARILTAEV